MKKIIISVVLFYASFMIGCDAGKLPPSSINENLEVGDYVFILKNDSVIMNRVEKDSNLFR